MGNRMNALRGSELDASCLYLFFYQFFARGTPAAALWCLYIWVYTDICIAKCAPVLFGIENKHAFGKGNAQESMLEGGRGGGVALSWTELS